MTKYEQPGYSGQKWMVPILEWYHGVMAGLTDNYDSALLHRITQLKLRRSRLGGLKPSTHARDRFRERWRPYAGKLDAMAAFYEALARAEPDEDAFRQEGDCSELWRAGPIAFIVKAGTAVTVLPMVIP